jgi:hypothetical protein
MRADLKQNPCGYQNAREITGNPLTAIDENAFQMRTGRNRMSKDKQIREVLGWFVVGFIVAALSVIPTSVNDLSVAGYVFGFFLGFIVPLASIWHEVKDLLMSKWSGVCGLTYAVGLLWESSALLSSGTSFWTLAWPILEGVVCLIASTISIIVQLIDEVSS